jgi:AraC family transcriptional regulator
MLLRSSEFSVLNVALSCGFTSHAHFTAVFKRMVGEPPNAWRGRMRGARSPDNSAGHVANETFRDRGIAAYE